MASLEPFDLSVHFAAALGNTSQLQEIYRTSPSLLHKKDDEGKTPIFYAAANKQLSSLQTLIDMKCKLNLVDINGQSCLHISAFHGFHDGARLLLENGAKPMVRDHGGRIPLHMCAKSFDTRCLNVLLSRVVKEQVRAKDAEGMTALHWACLNKRPNHVRVLLSKGAREDVFDVDKKSPLLWACQNGSINCVRHLLESKSLALINAPDKTGASPMHVVSGGGHDSVLRLLVSHHAEVNVLDALHRTPLHWAAAAGHASTISILLAANALSSILDSLGLTPIDYARKNSHGACLEAFAEYFPLPIAINSVPGTQALRPSLPSTTLTSSPHRDSMRDSGLHGCVDEGDDDEPPPLVPRKSVEKETPAPFHPSENPYDSAQALIKRHPLKSPTMMALDFSFSKDHGSCNCAPCSQKVLEAFSLFTQEQQAHAQTKLLLEKCESRVAMLQEQVSHHLVAGGTHHGNTTLTYASQNDDPRNQRKADLQQGLPPVSSPRPKNALKNDTKPLLKADDVAIRAKERAQVAMLKAELNDLKKVVGHLRSRESIVVAENKKLAAKLANNKRPLLPKI